MPSLWVLFDSDRLLKNRRCAFCLISQGPSASAYVTYVKPEDALRAILTVNNVHVDGRTLKTSLGTTKYCSHFLKGSHCQKNVSINI